MKRKTTRPKNTRASEQQRLRIVELEEIVRQLERDKTHFVMKNRDLEQAFERERALTRKMEAAICKVTQMKATLLSWLSEAELKIEYTINNDTLRVVPDRD